MAVNLQEFWKAIAETEREKLNGLSIEVMQSYHKYLSECEPYLLDGRLQTKCRDSIQAIDRKIESKQREEREDRFHQESQGIAKKGVRREDVAIVLAVVAILISGSDLIHRIFFSRTQPATSALASPPTYQRTPTPTAALTVRQESPSPSLEQTPTAQPSVSSPESYGKEEPPG